MSSAGATQMQLLLLFLRFPNISLSTALCLFGDKVSFEDASVAINTLLTSQLIARSRASEYFPWSYHITKTGQSLCTDIPHAQSTPQEQTVVQRYADQEAKSAHIGFIVVQFLKTLYPFGVPLIVVQDYLSENQHSECALNALRKLASLDLVQNTCNGLLWTSRNNHFTE